MRKKFCIGRNDLLENKELKEVLYDILTLAHNRKVYLVGGAIRDFFLGRNPCDFDFAVSGNGIEFAKKFARRIKGTFVLLSKKDDEARVVNHAHQTRVVSSNKLANSRLVRGEVKHKSRSCTQGRDKNIIFDFNGIGNRPLYDDLARRDFTVNALAIDLKNPKLIIDEFSGMRHLRTKVIVPVSENSLKIDPLRILRAFRLGLELNFKIDKEVTRLTKDITLNDITPERISYELLRICESPKSFRYIRLLHQLNLMQQIFPYAQELLQDKNLTNHSLRTYKKVESITSGKSYFNQFSLEFNKYFSDFPFRQALLKIAGLLHDIAKPHTQFETDEGDLHFYGHDNLGAKLVQKLAHEKLRLSRKQTQMLKTLVSNHMRLHLLATAPELSDRAIRRFFRDLGDEFFGLMILTYADGYATAKKTGHLERTITRMMKLKKSDDAKIKINRLITGNDLIELGYKPGPIYKPILQELEEMQLDGKIKSKQEGIEYIKTHYSKQQSPETSD